MNVMKSILPLLLILSASCFATFWEDFFTTEKTHTPVMRRKKTIGSHQEYLLKDDAQLFKIYDDTKKYLGSVILHKHYISNELDGNLNNTDVKRFHKIAKMISSKDGYPKSKKIKPLKKQNPNIPSDKMNSLYQGETLAPFMDYWVKH